MEILEEIAPIIKQYFNSAIIIDDELNPYSSSVAAEISLNNDEINSAIFDEDVTLDDHSLAEVATSSVANLANLTESPFSANDVFFEFIDEGFVTLPIQFSNDLAEEKYLKALKNAKLLILDWNLDGFSNSDFMGNSAINILNKYLETNNGLKCAIIYTRENLMDVQQKLNPLYDCTNYEDDVIYFDKKNSNSNSPYFGFILDKKINPKMIIDTISNILFEEKGLTLHLLESANFINNHLNTSVKQFNAPFEKVLSTQLITSEVSDNKITKFINEKLLSNILEYQYLEKLTHPLNFLYLNKRQKLINKLSLGIKQIDVSAIIDLLKIKGKNNGDKNKVLSLYTTYKQDVISILKDADTLDKFSGQIGSLITLKHQLTDEYAVKKIVQSFLLTLIILEDFNSVGEFQESFYKQTVTFTKLTKFLNVNDTIQTGSILNDFENQNVFLLCITPVCDIARISNINNKYKFIVGEIAHEIKESDLKNASDKYFYMGLPSDEKLIFIKWKFYETTTIDINDIKNYKNLNLLKTEYTQSIINRYIAYQSRAGIDEIYYKESNYINNFIDIIKNP